MSGNVVINISLNNRKHRSKVKTTSCFTESQNSEVQQY